jgi:hypothetical protein
VEVLQLQTPACPITSTMVSAPSAIWWDRVLLDGLSDPGLAATAEPDGLLHLNLQQEFEPSGGGTQRIETEVRMG